MTEPVLIVAAEASSSLYAQRLLEHWQKEGRQVSAFGIGSRQMEKLGFECLGRSEEMAVVGIQEVLAHLKDISKVFYSLIEQAKIRKPRFALLLDYPDFNFRLAKRLKRLGVTVVYYISPQLWAWRRGRIKQVQKYVDRMLVLFPFEKDFYQQHGVQVEFVGHPLLDEIDSETVGEKFIKEHREKFGLSARDRVLALMPGSRRSELNHHLQTQLETARLLQRKDPGLQLVLLIAPTLSRQEMQARIADSGLSIQLIQESPLEMIALADVVLVASGTATLMVGLAEKPMVIMYRMNAFTAFLAKRLVTSTPFFGMVNLIMQKQVAPELFQEEANPQRLADELGRYLNSSEARESSRLELRQLKTKLGDRGATKRVAEVLAEYWQRDE